MDIHKLHQATFGTLKTARLVLRPLKMEDALDMFEYTGLKESFQYIRRNSHQQIGETEKFIQDALIGYEQNTEFLWGVIYKDKLIGCCRLYNINLLDRNAEVSYMLNPTYRGKGMMTEAVKEIIAYAFESLELIRIQAVCDEENRASENLMLRLGMQLEGILRKHYYINGNYRNFKLYAILKDSTM